MVVKKQQILKKKWWPKNVLVTYLLVATELLFGLGVNRLKWPEMELIFIIEWCFHTTFAKKKVLL